MSDFYHDRPGSHTGDHLDHRSRYEPATGGSWIFGVVFGVIALLVVALVVFAPAGDQPVDGGAPVGGTLDAPADAGGLGAVGGETAPAGGETSGVAPIEQ